MIVESNLKSCAPLIKFKIIFFVYYFVKERCISFDRVLWSQGVGYICETLKDQPELKQDCRNGCSRLGLSCTPVSPALQYSVVKCFRVGDRSSYLLPKVPSKN